MLRGMFVGLTEPHHVHESGQDSFLLRRVPVCLRLLNFNGKRVKQTALRNRDRLRVGGFIFEVELTSPARAASLAPTSYEGPAEEPGTRDRRHAS